MSSQSKLDMVILTTIRAGILLNGRVFKILLALPLLVHICH